MPASAGFGVSHSSPSQVVDWDSALQFGRGIVDRSLDAISQCGCGGEMPQLEAARVHWCSQLLSLSLAATLFCPQRPSLLVRVPVQCHWGIPRCLGFVSCYRETVPGAAYKSAYTGLRRGSPPLVEPSASAQPGQELS